MLILDEPTNHLDVETVDALGVGLSNYAGGVILVSHDAQLINAVCRELWYVKQGSVRTLEDFTQYKRLVQDELKADVPHSK